MPDISALKPIRNLAYVEYKNFTREDGFGNLWQYIAFHEFNN